MGFGMRANAMGSSGYWVMSFRLRFFYSPLRACGLLQLRRKVCFIITAYGIRKLIENSKTLGAAEGWKDSPRSPSTRERCGGKWRAFPKDCQSDEICGCESYREG
jgi:hypothetical protein